jgi:hypothetical protein
MKNGGMAWHCLKRAVWQKRALPRWIAISYSKICGSWQACESPPAPSRHHVRGKFFWKVHPSNKRR